MDLLTEISKIQTDRQADQRIKAVLKELTIRIGALGTEDPCCSNDDDEADELRAELTALSEINDELEAENDELLAVTTELSETDIDGCCEECPHDDYANMDDDAKGPAFSSEDVKDELENETE